MDNFVQDIQKIRERARASIGEGAITSGYKADQVKVVQVLNEALATELVCVLRYKFHYYMADGLAADSVKAEFLEHAQDEQQHADMIAARITQLNGKPDFNPKDLARRSHAEYVEGKDLVNMIEEDLVAERIAIDTYAEIVRWLGDSDPTTRRLMENLLQKEEEHAEDLLSLLGRLEDLRLDKKK